MKRIHYSLFFLLSGLLFFSCKKVEYDSDTNLPRQFKPGDIQITAGQTIALLSWAPSLFTAGKNVTYTVEVSTDSTFQIPAALTSVSDSTRLLVTDSVLTVMQYYYARVRANQSGSTAPSGWVNSARFRITGEQIFLPVLDADLKDTSVVLRWIPTAGLTSIRLTKQGGTPATINLTAADLTASQKKLNGLTPLTQYTAEIYRNAVLKGTVAFTTKELNIFAITLNPGDDLVAAVAAAANGDIIGLQPGTYNCADATGAFVNLVVQQKTVTIQSVSGNPANTKVNFREVTLKGSGAGVTLRGIEFDGAAANATANQALYFLNLVGNASDAEAASFTKAKLENCIVHNFGNAYFRGNRGTNNNDHKIDTISVNNSLVYDNLALNAFTFFTLDKLQFKVLSMTNSTFYNLGRAFVSYSTAMTFPAAPVVTIDNCTINNFGRDARNNFFIDANTNTSTITVRNSIIANTPIPGQTVGTSLVRAPSASLLNSDYFKLTTGGATPTNLTWPAAVSQAANQTIDLGWTNTTTNFTLPAGSPLRTAATNGGPIGDPRWAQ